MTSSFFHFDAFSTVRTDTICMRFRFDPISRVFSNRCVFDENPQRIWVWTERLNASKCMRFQTKMHWCGRGRSDSYNSLVIKKSSQDKCIAHCLFSGFRVSSHLPPRWPAVFFCRWINERHGYIITQESVIKYGIPPRQETAPAINSWPTVCKGNIYNTIWTTIRGKQTRENNKTRINGIIITVIISDLCATFRATSNKT